MQPMIFLRFMLPALVFAIELVLTVPIVASAACVFDESTDSAHTGEEILRQQPSEISLRVRESGVAFPRREEPVARGCDDFVYGLVRFERQRPRVLELLTQIERQDEFLPNVESVSLTSASARESVAEYRFQLLFTRLVYRLRHRWSEDRWRVWWQLDDRYPNDLREIRDFWQLYEFANGHTLGVYGTHVDVGEIFPARIQATLTRQSLQRAIQSFRDWVNSDGGSSL
jgi:hypothetical protein